MRTVHCSGRLRVGGVSARGRGVCPGGCLPRAVSGYGGCLARRGVSAQGGSLPGGMSAQWGVCLWVFCQTPPVDRITDRC